MAARAEPGAVRLIGGRWRGRRLPVPAAAGLRPTPDRVRETLFNWLAPVITGSRCLDCFAGSGALGLEAASRGAAAVTLLERDRALARGLAGNIQRLDAAALVQVHTVDALTWLAQPPVQPPFDIVLLDPPYASDLLAAALPRLACGWVAAGGLVYLETARGCAWPALPGGWALSRDKTAGGVRYALAVAGDALPPDAGADQGGRPRPRGTSGGPAASARLRALLIGESQAPCITSSTPGHSIPSLTAIRT